MTFWIGYETGHEWNRIGGGLAIFEGNEDELIARTNSAVPRAVLGNKSAAVVIGWELFAIIKSELQRSYVRAEQHIGNDGPRNAFRPSEP